MAKKITYESIHEHVNEAIEAVSGMMHNLPDIMDVPDNLVGVLDCLAEASELLDELEGGEEYGGE